MKGNFPDKGPVDSLAQHKIPTLGPASVSLHNFRICSLFFIFEFKDFSKNSVPEAARSRLAEWKEVNREQREIV